MFARVGGVEISRPDVQVVTYPCLGGEFEFSGAVLGKGGNQQLRIFKKGERNFELEERQANIRVGRNKR